MDNRITTTFNKLYAKKQKAFIAFITAGDPDLVATQNLVLAFEKAGVDIIELGVPFSDPMADGATIQAASHRALAKGTTLNKIFDTVKTLRQLTEIPIALMTYYNPVFSFGDEAFIKRCKAVGVDGVIIPDLPPEEAGTLRQSALKENIATVFFVAPTTKEDRIKANAKASTGFVYYVSLTGVTGVKQAVANEVVKVIKRVKQFSSIPVCAGFGITNAEQAKSIAKVADGVIVGSAIIKEIQQHKDKKDFVNHVANYVATLVKAVK